MERTPFWRDRRVLRILLQIAFLLALVLAAGVLYANVQRGLDRLGLRMGFNFLGTEAGFGISEGIRYNPGDTYLRALTVGMVNTLRAALTGAVFATLIGLVFGVAGLSNNWLARAVSRTYVEVFRNVPLLLQLMVWYTAVVLKLPPVRQSLQLGEHVFFNQRGLYVPRPLAAEGFAAWLAWLGVAAAAAAAVHAVRLRALKRMDRPGAPALLSIPTFLAVAAAGWLAAPGSPLRLELPVLQTFNFRGGIHLTPEFTALILGLTAYTGAFIAEVVRGAIQSISKGQGEAAAALGLRPFQAMRLVILPQALRIVVPPMTNQYLNLTKNTSLAIAIGFPDLFNVGNTVVNQTGQSLSVFSLIMAAYLAMSLITSLFMNWYNRAVRLVER